MAKKKKSPARKKTRKKATKVRAKKRSAARKPVAKKSAVRKRARKKASAKKSATKQSSRKKASAKKSAARKPANKKASAKQSATGKPAAKKAASMKSAAEQIAVKSVVEPLVSLESRLLAPIAELEELLERFRKIQWQNPLSWDWAATPDISSLFDGRLPAVDIFDNGGHFIARAELPGVDKDDLEVDVSDRVLTIRGKTKHEKKKVEGDIHRQEIRAGAFTRSVTLSEEIDAKRVRASYKDGVLQLKLPKQNKSKKHSVKIK